MLACLLAELRLLLLRAGRPNSDSFDCDERRKARERLPAGRWGPAVDPLYQITARSRQKSGELLRGIKKTPVARRRDHGLQGGKPFPNCASPSARMGGRPLLPSAHQAGASRTACSPGSQFFRGSSTRKDAAIHSHFTRGRRLFVTQRNEEGVSLLSQARRNCKHYGARESPA